MCTSGQGVGIEIGALEDLVWKARQTLQAEYACSMLPATAPEPRRERIGTLYSKFF